MIRGLYNGAAALDVLARRQELISANLANVNTSGYRASRIAVSQSEITPSDDSINDLGPEVAAVQFNWTNGRLTKTDRPLDVSIVGDAFLEYETPQEQMYSRVGQLYRNPDSGELTNGDGYLVQDANGGSISIPDDVGDREIVITADGTITANGQELGQLSLVSFEDNNQLTPASQSYYQAGQNVQRKESEASVLQYHQEFSNGNAISELVSMIVGTRQYEAVQKVTQAISESLRDHIRS